MTKFDYNRTRVYGAPLQVTFQERQQPATHTGKVAAKKPECLVFEDGRTVFRSRILSIQAV